MNFFVQIEIWCLLVDVEFANIKMLRSQEELELKDAMSQNRTEIAKSIEALEK